MTSQDSAVVSLATVRHFLSFLITPLVIATFYDARNFGDQ